MICKQKGTLVYRKWQEQMEMLLVSTKMCVLIDLLQNGMLGVDCSDQV